MSFNNAYPVQPFIVQNRLNQMEQQYPQQGYQNNFMYQSPYSMAQQQQMLKGRPVTSLDEAKASMIDLDGSVFLFPDYANGKIYTKQINLDGTASLKVYTLSNPQATPPGTNAIQNPDNSERVMIESLQKRVSELENIVVNLQGGNVDVKSHADDKFNGRKSKSESTYDVSGAKQSNV